MFQENPYNVVKAELKNLCNIPYLALTTRCNAAIKIALETAKKMGKKKCVMFDQGGWMTYPEFAKELGFEIVIVETKDCKIDLSKLKKTLDASSVLIMHSLSGYFLLQPMIEIYAACQAKGALLINDCCGSIAEFDALQGDIIVCSFGRWKPINYGAGGFIGTRDSATFYKYMKVDETLAEKAIKDPVVLLQKVTSLQKRVSAIYTKSEEITLDMKKLKLSPIATKKNLVIVVPFETDEEKKKIDGYCKNHGLEYTECPREIRVLRKALSIEVKRLDT